MPKKTKLRDWPADQVTRAPIASIQPYPRNPRTHSDAQIKLLAQSIEQYGFTTPLLIDEDGVLLYGHGRLLAAQMLGLEEVPVCVTPGDWTDAEKSAYRIMDNQLGLLSGWDMPMLKAELHDLCIDGSVELNSLGFPELQLEGLGFGLKPPGDPEATPEPPAEPISERGDLWLLGEHRLLCGDACSAEDVASVLNGAQPHLTVTDPPYGVKYDPSWRADANKWKNSNVKIGGKAMGTVANDGQADWREAWALCPSDVIYAWSSSLNVLDSAQGLIASGFVLRSQIIWDKQRLVIGRGDYHWQHEPCWYAVRKGRAGHWQGSRTEATVWAIPKPQASETGHGTQKPVECMRRPIENNSKRGDAIYEPFSGSGTTIIAAETIGRRCLAIEIDPTYIDVAVLRWQTFTGKEAILEASGLTYVQTKEERKKTPRRSEGSSACA